MKDSSPFVSGLSLYAILLAISLAVAGCGCDEERPTLVFLNNSTAPVSVHVEDSRGGMIDIPELEGGARSSDYEVAPGATKLVLVWGSIPVPFDHEIETAYCYDYRVTFEGERVEVTQIER